MPHPTQRLTFGGSLADIVCFTNLLTKNYTVQLQLLVKKCKAEDGSFWNDGQGLWWSPWCYPGWITETPYWSVFRLSATSFAVGTECGSTARLSYEIRGPRH